MNCLIPLSQENTKIQVIMTEIATIQTLLKTVVTQLSVGYPVRSAEVTFDGETLVTDCTLLKSDTPFDFETVLDGRTVLDVETLG